MARTAGEYSFDFEVGYFFPGHGPEERIIGFVAGRRLASRLELDAELYNDHVMDNPPQVTTLDLGGRYNLRPGFNLLFIPGRSLSFQVLLTNYGRRLAAER